MVPVSRQYGFLKKEGLPPSQHRGLCSTVLASNRLAQSHMRGGRRRPTLGWIPRGSCGGLEFPGKVDTEIRAMRGSDEVVHGQANDTGPADLQAAVQEGRRPSRG